MSAVYRDMFRDMQAMTCLHHNATKGYDKNLQKIYRKKGQMLLESCSVGFDILNCRGKCGPSSSEINEVTHNILSLPRLELCISGIGPRSSIMMKTNRP